MLICAVDTCFAALGDELLRDHYLHQGKDACPKDDCHEILKYNHIQKERTTGILVAKDKIAHFCCFDPDFLSRCALMYFSYILSITYPAREII